MKIINTLCAILFAAILVGAAQSSAADARMADDPNLRDDETELGRIWARAHHPAAPSECPNNTLAFRLGCAQVVKGTTK